jgi:hypothetical protein
MGETYIYRKDIEPLTFTFSNNQDSFAKGKPTLG